MFVLKRLGIYQPFLLVIQAISGLAFFSPNIKQLVNLLPHFFIFFPKPLPWFHFYCYECSKQ
jgi:hypothetical protein